MAQAKVITELETFKPITLQITLETQGEVNALANLAGLPTHIICKTIDEDGNYDAYKEEDMHAVTCNIFDALEPFTK